MGYNDKFVADLEKFRIKSENSINDARKMMAYELFSRVIDRTPVYFSHEPNAGNTKFNWKCTINNLPGSVLKGTDKKGNATKNRMLAALSRVQGDDTIYFSNSVPWIFMLEDGLYPKQVKYGSWNKKTGKYEVRSSGGYSKQAPKGMVKVTLAEYPYIAKQAIQRAAR